VGQNREKQWTCLLYLRNRYEISRSILNQEVFTDFGGGFHEFDSALKRREYRGRG
jgi:hypothetical protein